MNAALRQICCCSWMGEVRVREDAHCAIHGLDKATLERSRLEGELLATAEALRDQRTEAMAALHAYRRTKKQFFELKARQDAL
jgi:hypothetical protein